MAKTYNTFTNVATGDVYTAAAHNNILTNLAGYRVPPSLGLAKTSDTNPFAAATAISWDSREWDGEGASDYMWTTGTDVTIKTSGIYVVSMHLSMSYTGGVFGTYALGELYVGGSRTIYLTSNCVATSTSVGGAGASILSLTAGNVLTFRVDHNLTSPVLKGAASGPTQTKARVAWLGQVS